MVDDSGLMVVVKFSSYELDYHNIYTDVSQYSESVALQYDTSMLGV